MSETSLVVRMFAPFGRLFDLRGRTARRDFWPYMLLLIATWLTCLRALITFGDAPSWMILAFATEPSGWFTRLDALYLPFILLGFAAVVRRLHDIGLNAWPIIIYILLDGAAIGCFQLLTFLMAGDGSSHAARPSNPILALSLMLPGLFMHVCFVALLVMCVVPGTRGPNRYGSDPRLGAIA